MSQLGRPAGLYDPEPLEEVWLLPLEAFRVKLRRMVRAALREGA